MDTQSIKIDLIHWLTELEDQSLLAKLKALKDGQSLEISDAHKRLLDERLKSYENDPNNILDWDDVVRDLDENK